MNPAADLRIKALAAATDASAAVTDLLDFATSSENQNILLFSESEPAARLASALKHVLEVELAHCDTELGMSGMGLTELHTAEETLAALGRFLKAWT